MFWLKGSVISLIILTLAGFSSAAVEEDHTVLQKRYVDINEHTPENHLIIRVKPIEQQVTFKEDEIDHSIQLKNGTKAVYLFGNQFNVLAFEKDGWQYMLNIDKRTSDVVHLDMLTAIANTIIETAK